VNRSLRFLVPVLIVSFLLLSTSGAVYAFPPLPSSFYGTVTLNGANVPDGTLVQALIHDKVVANSQTQTYQGDSVYSLDISGDDTSSAAVEGGVDGDTISFRIGGIQASQAGAWRSGVNVSLDLTASSADTPLPPQPSRTPLPTRTSIPVPPTRVPPTPTRIAELTTQGPPAQTSVPILQPTVSVGSSTALSTTGSLETPISVNPTQETQPTATDTTLQPLGNAQTSVPNAEPSPSVFAVSTKTPLSESAPDAGHETKSTLLWWIGILLVIVVLLVSGLWYISKKKRTAKG
jgi:hypothetical protein